MPFFNDSKGYFMTTLKQGKTARNAMPGGGAFALFFELPRCSRTHRYSSRPHCGMNAKIKIHAITPASNFMLIHLIPFTVRTIYSNLLPMRPKKHFGQHFLTSPSYARKIAEAVPAQAGEHVLEIGPGRGALSVFLRERFPEFHCVEIDGDAIAKLKEKLGEGRYTVHHADALAFDYGLAGFPLHVVGNLPYSSAAMIIKKTLLYGSAVRSFTFMVQREVAERIVALPHRKANGFLTIFCQFFAPPRVLFHIPPGAFFPKPKVRSSVVKMVIDAKPEERLPPEEWGHLFSFVSKAFTLRRKKLSKVIGGSAQGRERCENLLRRLGCGQFSRPEDLGINEWLGLFKEWNA
jgi:16S rRNA (adenine1518-N6/adenine1519-N6)-dimethyltransferase